MDQSAAEAAIQAVCEAALRPELWPDALHQISLACQSTAAAAQMVGANGPLVIASRGADGLIADHVDGDWQALNADHLRLHSVQTGGGQPIDQLPLREG